MIRLPKWPKNFLISLRVSILSIFITLFLISSLLIIIIRYIAFEDEVNYTATKIIHYISDNVLQALTSGIKPIELTCRFTAKIIEDGVLREREADLISYTYNLVNSLPLVQSVYWSNEEGDFISSDKEKNGSISSSIIMPKKTPYFHVKIVRDKNGKMIKREKIFTIDFDPRQRQWYQDVKTYQRFIWTDVYAFYPSGYLGITAAAPIYNQSGVIKGVLGFDISLDYLKRFITNQLISLHGYAFIITSNEDLVAYPDQFPFTNVKIKSNKLINVHEISLPLIDQTLDSYKKTGQHIFEMNYKGKPYIVSYQLVPQFIEYGWLIGVITQKKDFVKFLHQLNLITVIICLIILGLGILFVSNLVTRIVKPLNLLMIETEKIKHLNLEKDVSIVTRIKEIFYLKKAIFSMKHGLKQFQKYVPKTLMKQLIESGQDTQSGGERKELVVFFSDIENFTSIAEKMDPNELMLQVCEYFEALSQIIISQKGTIDKYIGDSVMAFWGAPLVEENPWQKAASAALACQEKLNELNKEWEKQNKPALITRIGIHMGDAIIGNLGSSERLNYTALGDTINIANRIESINKLYRTRILVSDAVYQLIKDDFVLRFVDHVVIKGRLSSLDVYELLTDHKAKLNFDIDAYQKEFAKGYLAYQQKNWNEAIIHFQACFKIYPADSLAPIFIERCASQQIK